MLTARSEHFVRDRSMDVVLHLGWGAVANRSAARNLYCRRKIGDHTSLADELSAANALYASRGEHGLPKTEAQSEVRLEKN